MAHLWIQHKGQWAVFPVSSHGYDLSTSPPSTLDGSASATAELSLVDREWVLLAAPDADVRVNGLAVAGNIHVLADRDEIAINGRRVYFSSENLAVVEEYSGKGPIRCPRCKLEVAGGQTVRCPGCSAVHHKDCWLYAPQCSLCPTSTPLDMGYQWTPEAL